MFAQKNNSIIVADLPIYFCAIKLIVYLLTEVVSKGLIFFINPFNHLLIYLKKQKLYNYLLFLLYIVFSNWVKKKLFPKLFAYKWVSTCLFNFIFMLEFIAIFQILKWGVHDKSHGFTNSELTNLILNTHDDLFKGWIISR